MRHLFFLYIFSDYKCLQNLFMSMAKISQCINEIQGTMQSEGRKERKIKENKKEKHNGSIR